MTPKIYFAIAGLLVFNLAFETDALQCYLCGNGAMAGMINCSDTFTGAEQACVNEPLGVSCVKQWSGGKIFHRGCYTKGYCTNMNDCIECDTDFCNSANSLILPLVLINSLIFLLFRFC